MLVSEIQYRQVTGDNATQWVVASALVEDAIDELERYLGRTLEYGTYTETVRVPPSGWVSPRALPLASVPPDSSYEVYDTATLRGVEPGDVPFVGWDLVDRDPLAGAIVGPRLISGYESRMPTNQVTYTGGYTADTLPSVLRRAICKIAYKMRPPALGESSLPAGVQSASVGDVSVTFAGATLVDSIDDYEAGLSRRLAPYRHPNHDR